MSVSYFILYRGTSADGQRFRDHYHRVHVPILLRFPGARSVSTHVPTNWSDAASVNAGGFELIAQIEFDTAEALNEALRSPERAAARADMTTNFPTFDGTVWHQATQTERFTS